jgi:large conductance mechanosensitive channel
MGMLKEFRDFAIRGNVIDLAVAVIIGGAFGAIVTALTDKILMPIIGSFIGKDFATLTAQVNGVDIQYGAFIQAIINFILIAFLVFLMVKGINRMKKKEAPAVAVTPEEVILLREIRDSLRR